MITLLYYVWYPLNLFYLENLIVSPYIYLRSFLIFLGITLIII